ncbi:MAG TPA: TetR/AcrR family transcriptional regulator [Polyangiaceae bacterium]|nr:TetR/AcrR family transcriptional regulator [Polyangiaceae bacterium]
MPTRAKLSELALRERILRGAAAAFGKLGYASTRVQDIVQEAGISRPTFYKLFDSKDAVFLALSETHHDTIRERLAQAYASTDDPAQQLGRALESFLRWRAELGPVGRVLDLEARSPGTLLEKQRRRTLAQVIELAQSGLKRAGRQPVDPALLRALVAAAENVADELFVESPVSEAVMQRAKAIVLRIHAAALAKPEERLPALPLATKMRTRRS